MCMLGAATQLPLPGLSQDPKVSNAETNAGRLSVMGRLC